MMRIALLCGIAAAAFAVSAAHATTTNTTLAAPGTYYGSGNSGTNNWTVNTVGGVEFGLTTILRGVGNGTTPSFNTSGVAVYHVATGSDPHASSRALWNFDFSINLQGHNPALTLADIVPTLSLYDVATNVTRSFNPLAIADDSGYGPGGKNVAGSNLGIDFGVQNSENLTFSDIGGYLDPTFDLNANDTYVFTLSATAGGVNLGSVRETTIVGTGAPVPEPSSLALFGSGGLALLGIGMLGMGRKRRI
jgi:hypothetical protein